MFKYLLLLTIAAQSCLDASGHGLGRKRAVFKKSAVGPIQGKDQAQQAAKLGLFGKNAQTPANTTTMDGWTTLKNAAVVTIPFDVLDDDADKLFVAALTASDFADINAKMVRIDGWRGRVQAMRKQHASLFPVYYWTLPFENQDLTAISCVEGAPMDLITGHYVGKMAQNQHPLDGINNQRSFNAWTQTAKPVIFGEQFPAFMYSKKERKPQGKNIIQNTGAQGLTLLRANIKEAHVQYIADYPKLFEACIDAIPRGGGAALIDGNARVREAARFVASAVGQRAAVEFERRGMPALTHNGGSPNDVQQNYNELEDHIAIAAPGQIEFFVDHILYFLTHFTRAEFVDYIAHGAMAPGVIRAVGAIRPPAQAAPALLQGALGAAKAGLVEPLFIESALLLQAAFAQLMIPESGQGQVVRDKALESLEMLWPSNPREHLQEKGTNYNLLRYTLAPTLYNIPMNAMLNAPNLTVRQYAQAMIFYNLFCEPFEQPLADLKQDLDGIAAAPVGYGAALAAVIQNRFVVELGNGEDLEQHADFLNEIARAEAEMNGLRPPVHIARVDLPMAFEYPTLGELLRDAPAHGDDGLITHFGNVNPNLWLPSGRYLIRSLAQSAALPSIYSPAIAAAIQRRVQLTATCLDHIAQGRMIDAGNPSLCGEAHKEELLLLIKWFLDSGHMLIPAGIKASFNDFIDRYNDLRFAVRYNGCDLTFGGILGTQVDCINRRIPNLQDIARLARTNYQERVNLFPELLNIIVNEMDQYA